MRTLSIEFIGLKTYKTVNQPLKILVEFSYHRIKVFFHAVKADLNYSSDREMEPLLDPKYQLNNGTI